MFSHLITRVIPIVIRSVTENAQYREVNEIRRQGKKRQGYTGEYLRNEEKRWRLEVLFLLSRCVGRIIRTQTITEQGWGEGRERMGEGAKRGRGAE